MILLLIAGFLIRLIYYLEYTSLIEFSQPTVDSLYHHLLAMSIADGALASPEPFFRAPFYNYFLGLIYWLTSDSIGAARFVQLLIGTLNAPLVFLLARDLFDRRTAILASLLVLLSQDLVYFEAELLLESVLITMLLLCLYLVVRYLRVPRLYLIAIAGFIAGTATVTRPNAVLVLIPMVWLIWKNGRLHNLRPGKSLAMLLLAALLPVVAVVAHNATREQPAFTIATQGGINFFIGNNKAADGVSAVMPGELGFNWQYSDIEYLAE